MLSWGWAELFAKPIGGVASIKNDGFREELNPSYKIYKNQNGLVTIPPSARSAAPLVALEAFEQT